MKKSLTIFLIAICLFLAHASYAQVWKDAFDKGISALQQAEKVGYGKSELTQEHHKEKLRLYNSAAENFAQARDNSRKMAPASVYFIATSLYNASKEESALGKDADAYATIKRAIAIWPELNVVPAAKFINEQRVRVNGKRKTYDALGDAADWQHAYFKSYVRAMQLANALKKFDEAITYGDFILDEADTLDNETFIANAELSEAYINKQDNCKGAEYAMDALEGAQLYTFENKADREVVNQYLNRMAVNVSPSKDCRFDAVKWEERAALALARIHYLEDMSFYVLLYGKDAYNRGRKNSELLISLAEAEYYLSKKPERIANDDEKTNWFAKVEENKKTFNSAELRRLAAMYASRGNAEMEKTTLKHAKRKFFWENTHFGFSTNPANFYWGQYLGVFDLMMPRQTHEIRVNYNTHSTHLFWREPSDTSSENSFFKFSGYEISYTLKFMERDMQGSKSKLFYSGPQLRIENRDYEPVTEEVFKTDGDPGKTYLRTIDPSSMRYEALLILGMQQRTKWFFIDQFFGVGGGWKTFEMPNIPANETVKDDRFRPGKWNKFYVPVHAGFRIGFILK